jgi:putative flippase GtrA
MGSVRMQTQPETALRLSLATQLGRFGVIGVCTVALDFGVLYGLVDFAHLNYFVSAFVAFMTASTLNYVLSVQYVFVGGRFGRGPEFTMFMLITGVGLGLNQFTMWMIVSFAGSNYLLAKCISLTIVTCWNFLAKKRIVFLD